MDQQAYQSQEVNKMKKEESKTDKISQFAQKLLAVLEITANLKIEEKDGIFNLELETENPGILIGYHGETLSAFQLILSMMTYRELGEWSRIVVNIGDYRQRRQEALERMAASACQKVKFSGQEYELPPMSAGERRIIHLALSDHPDVETESRGEGRERRVAIKPKSA